MVREEGRRKNGRDGERKGRRKNGRDGERKGEKEEWERW